MADGPCPPPECRPRHPLLLWCGLLPIKLLHRTVVILNFLLVLLLGNLHLLLKVGDRVAVFAAGIHELHHSQGTRHVEVLMFVYVIVANKVLQ